MIRNRSLEITERLSFWTAPIVDVMGARVVYVDQDRNLLGCVPTCHRHFLEMVEGISPEERENLIDALWESMPEVDEVRIFLQPAARTKTLLVGKTPTIVPDPDEDTMAMFAIRYPIC